MTAGEQKTTELTTGRLLGRHLAAMAGLSILVVVRWWQYLSWPSSLIDEDIYLRAFRAASEGLSPYSVDGYYYPSAFAVLGGHGLSVLGYRAMCGLLRAASVLGLVVSVWLSLSWWPTSWSRRLVVAAMYLSLAPAVRLGFQTGNISFVVIAAVLVALLIWRRWPVMSGLLLGGSVAVKPLAPLATLVLGLHRPIEGGRRHWVAAMIGAASMVLVLLPVSSFTEMAELTVDRLPYIRSVSLQRMLTLMGLEVGSLVIAGAVGILVLLVTRAYPMNRSETLFVATTAAVLATPVIWSHTLLLTLPVQVAALVTACARRRRAPRAGARRRADVARRYELLLVSLCVAALQLTEGAGAVDRQAVPFQIVALAVPYLASPALTAYVLAAGTDGRRAARAES